MVGEAVCPKCISQRSFRMSYKLPDRFRDKVSAFPESSYGVSLVTLVLDDGTRIPHVRVAWGVDIVEEDRARIDKIDLGRIVDIESDL